MSSLSPVRAWLCQLRDGDARAAQDLWDTYFLRMVRAARAKLQGAPGRMADEEDVALSAFKSFCRGTREGRFAPVPEHDDPWPLLLALTKYKAIDLLRHERRIKRGGGGSNTAEAEGTPEPDVSLSAVIGKELDPQEAFRIAESCQEMLDGLSDSILRAIALWKSEGFTTEEIAARLGCTTRTVERKLQLIRRAWVRGDAL